MLELPFSEDTMLRYELEAALTMMEQFINKFRPLLKKIEKKLDKGDKVEYDVPPVKL